MKSEADLRTPSTHPRLYGIPLFMHPTLNNTENVKFLSSKSSEDYITRL